MSIKRNTKTSTEDKETMGKVITLFFDECKRRGLRENEVSALTLSLCASVSASAFLNIKYVTDKDAFTYLLNDYLENLTLVAEDIKNAIDKYGESECQH